MLLLILIFCLTPALIPQNILAQESTLRGIIIDAETAAVLPGANITLISATVETGTAARLNGTFEIKGLQPGSYKVEITFIGYEKIILEDLTLSAGQTRWLDIRLKPGEIQLNPITVTASRRPEKLLEAPASITVLEAEAIESRMALTPTEHLKALPAVDIISAGLNQSRVVIRGFNDLFSGSLLSMVDNRITRIPAVRLNAFQVIPTNNDDIERIEIVSGPASALYGPNSANGVMHVLTKSPFDSKGTTLSVGGGERDVFLGTLRHAGSFGDRVGYKLSFQHYRGKDFISRDPIEDRFRDFALTAGANPDSLRIGDRVFDIRSTAFDGRIDFRFSPEFSFIVNGGYSNGDNLEITNQGAAQALDATFNYLQGRLRYKNFFVQSFINRVTTGDTYFLRSGQSIINNSSLFVTQAQHTTRLGERQSFAYGFDILLTRPVTEGTVNGRNEDNDSVNEVGFYFQSETTLSRKLKIVTAARLDDHNRLKGINFSPRAALVFKPSPKDNFRITFNKAFTTPTSDMLFTDNLGGSQPTAAIDPALVPFFGDTLSNVRALGTWPHGFSFNFGNDGRPQMVPTFSGVFSDQYVAPDVNSVWPALRDLIITGTNDAFQQAFLNSVLPDSLSRQVPGILRILDTESPEGQFNDVDAAFVTNIRSVFQSSNITFELGYKGLLGKRLLARADVYHTRIKDFIGPLQVITPSVFVDTLALETVLAQDLVANGVPEIIAQVTADGISDSLAALPIGIVSPQEIQNGTDIVLSYRNLGDVSVTGVDLSLTYHVNHHWSLTGNYSFVNRDFFRGKARHLDVALNAPKHKFGAIIDYRNSGYGLNGNLRLRFIDSFPVLSGTFRAVGEDKVQRYAVVDLNATYRLPFSDNTRLSLSIQNVMNNKHREFVGVPEIGRMTWMRVAQTL